MANQISTPNFLKGNYYKEVFEIYELTLTQAQKLYKKLSDLEDQLALSTLGFSYRLENPFDELIIEKILFKKPVGNKVFLDPFSDDKKLIIKAQKQLNIYIKAQRSDITLGNKKKVLTLSKETGTVSYFSNQGNKHEAKFQTKSNSFRVLYLLATHKDEPLKIMAISKVLKKVSSLAKNNDPDRRVRDSIKDINKKMKLNKSNTFIKVTQKQFVITCEISFI